MLKRFLVVGAVVLFLWDILLTVPRSVLEEPISASSIVAKHHYSQREAGQE